MWRNCCDGGGANGREPWPVGGDSKEETWAGPPPPPPAPPRAPPSRVRPHYRSVTGAGLSK